VTNPAAGAAQSSPAGEPDPRQEPGGGTARQRAPVRIGALVWTQHTSWPDLMDAGRRADEAGLDDLWVWDHLLPIKGRPEGPIFEPLMTLAGWASRTSRVRIGPMVAANTFRNPALLVKMITALDHMTAGRAILGLGAGWYEDEHRAFGIEYGESTGQRLDWLDEAAAMVRALLHGEVATARGPHFSMDEVANDPPPVQARLPLLIGGSGARKTLATVARYADVWNTGGDVTEARAKDALLREWCQRVGRDESTIERSIGVGPIVIRDRRADATRVAEATGRLNGGWDEPITTGSPAEIVDRIAPYVEIGFRTIHFDVPAPFDAQTMERFASEVRPALDRVAGRP
jgi:alkanesulfonate monooxygenase SsuD/methylene tetrahydromethanopterin reductase-like flavin-dependent oxidoreductase (luciferase family)